MRRQPGLNEDPAPLRPASGAAGDLAQKLEAALGRAEIREIDPNTRVDGADESGFFLLANDRSGGAEGWELGR